MTRKPPRDDPTTSQTHVTRKAKRNDIGTHPEVGEEFVPEETAGLVEPHGSIRSQHKASVAMRTGIGALWTIVLFIILGYGLWWRKEKIETGYCGVAGLGTCVSSFITEDTNWYF